MSEACAHDLTRRGHGAVFNLFGKLQETSPSAKRLLTSDGRSDENFGVFHDSNRISYGLDVTSGACSSSSPERPRMTCGRNAGNDFTIGAYHSSGSRSSLRIRTKKESESLTTTCPILRDNQSKLQQRPTTPPTKKPAPEIAALSRELQRMFKLQLGPLTIGRDIQPVLDMWSKLLAIRTEHGRKAVADLWAKLAQATAIVSRKMTIDDILATIDIQICLIQPCPRGLRLPSAMFTALADRAGAGGELESASKHEFLHFCSSVGRLMVLVGGLDGSSSPGTVMQCTKALDRVSATVPLAQTALAEIVRRSKDASRRLVSDDEAPCDTITSTLLVAEALAELGGLPLSESDVCLRRASLAAAAEAEEAHKQPKDPSSWWQKISISNCLRTSQEAQASSRQLPITHAISCAVEIQRLAGEAAECMARCLAPSAVPNMSTCQLSKFAKSIRDATYEDDGHPSHEPLRQCLGLVLEEVSRRAAAQDSRLTRSCVKTTISISRGRLLHVHFKLAAPMDGVAAALAKLEAWKWKDSQQAQMGVLLRRHHQQNKSFEKEATSLEMKEYTEEENGDEVTSGSM